jgi:hypothetical protein
MAINPACTPGWIDEVLEPGTDVPTGELISCCGCGWEQDGFHSVGAAKRAQRAHRFPGPNPAELERSTA